MRILIDTNILLRLAQVRDSHYGVTLAAIEALLKSNHSIHYSPQVAREFWHVGTRSTSSNGFGLTPNECDELLDLLTENFSFLDDESGIHFEWRQIVSNFMVSGAKCHDANHVAFAIHHKMDAVLTFDPDLHQFIGDKLEVFHPSSI